MVPSQWLFFDVCHEFVLPLCCLQQNEEQLRWNQQQREVREAARRAEHEQDLRLAAEHSAMLGAWAARGVRLFEGTSSRVVVSGLMESMIRICTTGMPL